MPHGDEIRICLFTPACPCSVLQIGGIGKGPLSCKNQSESTDSFPMCLQKSLSPWHTL